MSQITSFPSFQTPAPVIQAAYRWIFAEEVHHQQDESQAFLYQMIAFAGARQNEIQTDLCIEDQLLFKELAKQWQYERGVSSSTTEIILSPAYQSIIGMGEKAIPLIFSKLQSEGSDPDQWFWALQFLTRTNPVAEEDEGDFLRMSQAWLAWAAAAGYAW